MGFVAKHPINLTPAKKKLRAFNKHVHTNLYFWYAATFAFTYSAHAAGKAANYANAVYFVGLYEELIKEPNA